MPNVKRIADLSQYQGVLPYASELFGVYQSLIGWRSRRMMQRVRDAGPGAGLVKHLAGQFASPVPIGFNVDCGIEAERLVPGVLRRTVLAEQSSILLKAVTADLRARGGNPPGNGEWRAVLSEEKLSEFLNGVVRDHYQTASIEACKAIDVELRPVNGPSYGRLRAERRARAQQQLRAALEEEIAVAGALLRLLAEGRNHELESVFFTKPAQDPLARYDALLASVDTQDPYLAFDPARDAKDATLSPVSVVHLYRQYFFELDSFLGTPVGHVWMAPGATVELVEVSTRKTVTEQTTELSTETSQKSERTLTTQDDLSEAVKEDNKNDLKLGVTTTVRQSWGTGNATATGSLNMDRTQAAAREFTHKRMRQQSEKLSSEIRENRKTTFRTVTETTDTSSKRYVLENKTGRLLNYEMRRKMRQVGVQVQDIGSYLCWESFVDEPGADLGLASLVHIASPADLLPVPDTTKAAYPPDRPLAFQANAVWDFGDTRKNGLVQVGVADPPPPPEGYEVIKPAGRIRATQVSASGEDFKGTWAFTAEFNPEGQLVLYVETGLGGLEWDKRVDFVVAGVLTCTARAEKKNEIDAANKVKEEAGEAATQANDRKTREQYLKVVGERVEAAAAIPSRRSEDLREEERIIVYRRLISDLMTGSPYASANAEARHVLSQLINAIFDIDKMLYFVAPEYWRPRTRARQHLSLQDLQARLADSLVTWSDGPPRDSNYLVTGKSAPARMGSSLGWLLQLDGDDLRNAFLNAPWVKAVIPIRPGQEEAAIAWLRNAGVEGSDGLDAAYAAPQAELVRIRARIGLADDALVTIGDALRFLCMEVADKHRDSLRARSYPPTEIDDRNKVSATPVDKVYEHGFYPLKGGFRSDPTGPDPDPNNTDRTFQVFDQWVEVLPTDQVAPVEVEYNPRTGRMMVP